MKYYFLLNNFFLIGVWLIVMEMGFAQVPAIRDTIALDPDRLSYVLSHHPVRKQSVQLFVDGRWFDRFTVNDVAGTIELDSIPPNAKQLIAYYEWLDVPVQVGPFYTLLPVITDSIQTGAVAVRSAMKQETPPLVSSGTFFRSIGFSPISGSDFSGGLQFQIQGQLSQNLFINGILSDQDIPIQPEGNTQALDEIDKVLITVTAPNYSIEAGDLDFRLQEGSYLTLQRKVTGLSYSYANDSWMAEGMIGGNQGEYHTLLVQGEDGRQGPYFLTSREGNRDIVVQAGTEKIYLNGTLLQRGENLDYIIDYSRGEVTFNPSHLIHFDSEIYMEYQYSDYAYTKNSNAATIHYHGDRSEMGVGWFREQDVFSRTHSQLPQWAVDSLTLSGDEPFLITDAIADSNGRYILENGIYIYDPLNTSSMKYKVSFYSDGQQGSYIKRVSPEGQLYFEYVMPEDRNIYSDLYSPGRLLQAPQSEIMFQLTGNSRINRYMSIASELAVSGFDQNTLSDRDAADNNGTGFQARVSGTDIPAIGSWKAGYSLAYRRQDSTFHVLALDRDVFYQRTWNTYTIHGNEQILDGNLQLVRDNIFRLEAGKSVYDMNNRRRDRVYAKSELTTYWIPSFSLRTNRVNDHQTLFQQYFASLTVLPGYLHPIFSFTAEDDESATGYEWITGGMIYEKGKNGGKISIGKRNDYTHEAGSRQLKSSGLFQELNFTRRTSDGWSGFVKLRKRLLDNRTAKAEDVNVLLGQINARYSRRQAPVRLDINLRSERTFAEQKVIIYDSVGTGFGHYRFDPIYQEYIPDPNGAYIAQTAYIGQRKSVRDGESLVRIRFTGRKTKLPWLKPFETILELKSIYTGSLPYNLARLNPQFFEAEDIDRARRYQRIDLYYRSAVKERNIKIKSTRNRDLVGTDPRGADMKQSDEFNLQWLEPLSGHWQVEATGNRHWDRTFSTISSMRERKNNGWWFAMGPVWSSVSKHRFKGNILKGFDEGQRSQGTFHVTFSAMELEYVYFYKNNTRLQIALNITDAALTQGTGTIPPEANRGLPVGYSVRFQGSVETKMTDKLTLNIYLSYIDNSRYNNFVAMNGELRAYF